MRENNIEDFDDKPLDPILLQKLESIQVPENMRMFSRISRGGLDVIGVEAIESQPDQVQVIALPGSSHGNWSFIDLLPPIAQQNIPLQALSFPGDGRSRPFSKPLSELVVQDYVDSVVEFLREVEGPAVLMGHSFGGLIAQEIAADPLFLEKVRGLILINALPPSNLRHSTRLVTGEFSAPKDSDVWKDRLFTKTDQKDRAWWYTMLNASRFSNNVKNDCGINKTGGFVDPQRIQCPIIELSGDQDVNILTSLDLADPTVAEYGPTEKRISIGEFYLNNGTLPKDKVILERIPGGTHDMMLGEHSKEVANAILRRFEIFQRNNV